MPGVAECVQAVCECRVPAGVGTVRTMGTSSGMTHTFLRLQRFAQAERAAIQALTTLASTAESPSAAPEVLSLYGALHLAAALLRARGSKPRRGQEAPRRSRARRRPTGTDRDDFGTEFGSTNVLLHRISIAADLGDADEPWRSPHGSPRKPVSRAPGPVLARHRPMPRPAPPRHEAPQALLNAETCPRTRARPPPGTAAAQRPDQALRQAPPQELAELADRIEIDL